MEVKLLHIGFGNFININRVVAIASPNSLTRREINALKEWNEKGKNGTAESGRGHLIDMTRGRRTKSVIFTDSDDIILAALAPETIAGRLDDRTSRQDMELSEESERPALVQ
jgi:regulator of extracellular matrix RemA (YlzA/DUF370 family)